MILKRLSKFWPILILISLGGFVAWKNVVPGTYLTGWDNLHPEFDFNTNIIDRGINGVWQYYQGLGVPSGNAHVADLPRQIVLWVASWVVPQNLIRYGYHLTAWLVGGIGLYYLLFKMLTSEVGYHKKQVVALVGSIFYLFNLGTLQNFYAPYESFSHFYLMLPWLLYVFLSYLRIGGKKDLLWLLIVNLLAVPMSYIPTIFIVYTSVIGCVGLGELIKSRLKSWKRVFIGGLMILVVNSFWLLPFGHFVMNNAQGVVEAKINRMFTQEAFLRNEEYGELKHSLIMEGFWFDTTDMTLSEGEHDFMMRPWMDYMDKPEIRGLMWTLIAMIFMGYLYALFTRKTYSLLFLSVTTVGLFALVNTNWPSGELFKFMQDNVPLFGQVFRFPFTKFILLVVIGYSIGLAWFAELLLKYLKSIGNIFAVTMIGIVMFVQIPVLNGHFFYDNLRLKVPTEYFELFKFFQNEDRLRGRIANLPQPTFWGWTTYGWGYRGSGFPWYGIPQPMLDRNFDVWSPESEHYYNEVSNAIYANDSKEYFLRVLDKYGVDYVWIDGWVVNPHKPEMLDMLQVVGWLNSGGYSEVYKSGRQIVYKRNSATIQKGVKRAYTPSYSGYTVVDLGQELFAGYDFLRYGDRIYESSDDKPRFVSDREDWSRIYQYLTKDMKSLSLKNPELNYLYNLQEQFAELELDDRVWWIREIYIAYDSEVDGKLEICLAKGVGNDCYYIGVDTNPTGGYRWGKFVLKDTTSPSELNFVISGNVKMREIRFGYFDVGSGEQSISELNVNGAHIIELSLANNNFGAKNCYLFGKGDYGRKVMTDRDENFVRYSASDASSCETMNIGNSEILASGGTISIRTRNISGRPVKFCLRHDPPGDCLVEEIVEGGQGEWVSSLYQILPVTKIGDLYLEVDNYAVGKEVRVNDVGEITLKSEKLDTGREEMAHEKIYSNNQAFRDGWIGVDFKSWQLLEHVKVDGWANGWIVDYGQMDQRQGDGQVVVIFYWPQLLQYLGFGILVITFSFILYRPKDIK